MMKLYPFISVCTDSIQSEILSHGKDLGKLHWRKLFREGNGNGLVTACGSLWAALTGKP